MRVHVCVCSDVIQTHYVFNFAVKRMNENEIFALLYNTICYLKSGKRRHSARKKTR